MKQLIPKGDLGVKNFWTISEAFLVKWLLDVHDGEKQALKEEVVGINYGMEVTGWIPSRPPMVESLEIHDKVVGLIV